MTDDRPATRAELGRLCALAGRPQMTDDLIAEGVTLAEAKARIAAAPGIIELFVVASAFNPVDPTLGQVLADRGCSLQTAVGVLRALTRPRPPDIEIPEGAMMH